MRVAGCAAAALALWALAAVIAFRTEVRIASDGSQVTWTVDGTSWTAPIAVHRVERLSIEAARSAYPMGGETLTIDQGQKSSVHRLPRRFALPPPEVSPTGDWDVDRNVVEAPVFELPLEVRAPFEIRATFTGRCLKFTTLRLRGDPTIDFRFRRGYLNNDAFIGPELSPVAGGSMNIRPLSRAATALEFLARAAAFAAAIAAFFQAIALLRPKNPEDAEPVASRRNWRRWSWVAVALLAATLSGISWWVATSVLGRLPHTPDEVAYRLQAKWLARGRLVGELPAALTEFIAVPFTASRDGAWITQYPIGWPLILAPGERLDRPELVNPLLAVVYALLLHAAAKRLFGRREAVLAVALAAFSPMALLMFGSYLSHGSAAVLVLLAFVMWLESDRCSSPWKMGCSGVALGYCFGIRPLTAIAIGLVLGVWSIVALLRDRPRRGLSSLAAWVGGGLVGALPVLAHNGVVAGNPFVFAYTTVSAHRLSLDHVPEGLLNLDVTLAALGPSLFGWGWALIEEGWIPISFALGIVVVPFFLRRCGRGEWLLAAIFLVVTAAYVFHAAHGVHGYGARFYFEAYFALYVLAARGLVRLADSGVEASADRRLAAGLRVAVLAGTAALVLVTASTLPERLRLYRGYNGVSGALDRAIREQAVERGLVLFLDSFWYNDSVPWAEASNAWDGSVDSPLVFASGGRDNDPLFAQLPQRPVLGWRSRRLFPVAAPDLESHSTSTSLPAEQPESAEQRFAAAFGEIDDVTIEVRSGAAEVGAPFDLAGARSAGVLDTEANDASFSTDLDALFDHDVATLSRTEEANPLVLQFRFARPVRVAAVKIFPSYSTYDWAVRPRADGPRYAMRAAAAESWSRIDLPEPAETTELRLELRRLERDDHVHLNEVELLVATDVRAPRR